MTNAIAPNEESRRRFLRGVFVAALAGFAIATSLPNLYYAAFPMYGTFGVVPEFGARVGYQVTPSIQAFVGYTFLYWNQVARAGNEVDLGVNPNLLPFSGAAATGAARPLPVLNSSGFWAQGIDFGFQLRF